MKDPTNDLIAELTVLCGQLHEWHNTFQQTLDPLAQGVHGTKLTQQLRLRTVLKWLKDFAKELEKPFNTHGATIDRLAYESMEEDDMEEIVVDGVKFKPTINHRFNVPQDDREAFIDWVKDNNPEIVREDVHPRTRDSYLTELVESGQKLPASVTHFPQLGLTARRLPRR